MITIPVQSPKYLNKQLFLTKYIKTQTYNLLNIKSLTELYKDPQPLQISKFIEYNNGTYKINQIQIISQPLSLLGQFLNEEIDTDQFQLSEILVNFRDLDYKVENAQISANDQYLRVYNPHIQQNVLELQYNQIYELQISDNSLFILYLKDNIKSPNLFVKEEQSKLHQLIFNSINVNLLKAYQTIFIKILNYKIQNKDSQSIVKFLNNKQQKINEEKVRLSQQFEQLEGEKISFNDYDSDQNVDQPGVSLGTEQKIILQPKNQKFQPFELNMIIFNGIEQVQQSIQTGCMCTAQQTVKQQMINLSPQIYTTIWMYDQYIKVKYRTTFMTVKSIETLINSEDFEIFTQEQNLQIQVEQNDPNLEFIQQLNQQIIECQMTGQWNIQGYKFIKIFGFQSYLLCLIGEQSFQQLSKYFDKK